MDRILIRGGHRLRGEVRVAGAGNAALPLLASSLLCHGTSTYTNVPRVDDVRTMARVLTHMGAVVAWSGASDAGTSDPAAHEREPGAHEREVGAVLRVRTDGLGGAGGLGESLRAEVPYESVLALRASVLVLGPLLARHGRARVALPGGSSIGSRPIDQHLKGLAAMGAVIELRGGDVVARARRLRGASIALAVPTVTGTENLMMAASLAEGRTLLENAAREPEVEELGRVLNKMGARVQGAGTATITIEGVEELAPIEHAIMPDRIEAGTLLVAAALTGGDVRLVGAVPDHLGSLLARLRGAGIEISVDEGGLRVRGGSLCADGALLPLDITTAPYPGFPTDMQPQLMVLASRARGQSVITEALFACRMEHAGELARLGADITVEGCTAIIRGPTRLGGAPVRARDPHAVAALLLAGLIAEGQTEVHAALPLLSACEHLEHKLRALGADIERVTHS